MDDNNRIAIIFAVAIVMASAFTFVIWLLVDWTQPYWPKLIEQHFAAIIGLPAAAVCSFVIVVFLKQTSVERIEFEGLGFKFKGPSGEVILWLMCFIGISLAVKLLW